MKTTLFVKIKLKKKIKMKSKILLLPILFICLLFACNPDETTPTPEPPDDEPTYDFPIPDTYTFERGGQSTIDLTVPAINIRMGEALINAMYDYKHHTHQEILDLWNNENNPFSDDDLNNYPGSVRETVASSNDLYGGGNATSEEIRSDMENWMDIWMNEVAPNYNQHCGPGVPGQIADWVDTRYVDGDGMEYLQVVSKSLDGALYMDQIVNHWLSEDILEAGNNLADNDNEVLVAGQNYTAMEFAWDQAYGHIYGLSKDQSDPMATMGKDDFFLNKYVKLIDNDDDFEGIAQTIFDAFHVGRAALVAGDYEEMRKQANIVKREVSNVMIIRTAFYLQSGVNEFEKTPPEMGAYLHDTGEGWGFVYSLEFAKNPATDSQYFTRAESEDFRKRILIDDGPNGLSSTKMQTLRDIADEIAARMPWEAEDAKDF